MEKVKILSLITVKISGEWGSDALTSNAVNIIRTANFTNSGVITFHNVIKREIESNVVEKKKLINGDIIIEKSGGSPSQPVGRVVYFENPDDSIYLCNNFTTILRPNIKKVNPKYLFYLLNNFYQTDKVLSFQNNTTGIINLKLDRYLESEISYESSLDTQNKIVAILDKATALIQKREVSIKKIEELLVSKFKVLFGSVYNNEKKWNQSAIGEYIVKLIAGSSYGGEDKKVLNKDELGVLKVSAVTKGIFNPKEYKAVSKSLITKKTISPTKGDLLFSRANTPELVGASCIVDEDYPQLFLPDKLWNIIVDENHIRKPYLHYLLQDINFKKALTQYATGSSGSMYNISMESLRNLVCPTPPIEIQIQFENIFNKTTLIRKKLINSLDEITNLSKVLLQKAFKGELEFNTELPLNIEIELEILLENDYEYFKQYHTKKNIETLIDRLNKNPLNQNKFTVKEEYNKAKQFVFDLLKDKKIKQVFNEKTKSIELQVV